MRCTRMLGRNFQFRISQRVISNIKSIFSYIKLRLTREQNTRRDVCWSHAANVKTSWAARRNEETSLQGTSFNWCYERYKNDNKFIFKNLFHI
jgi:hypothetical protein